MIFKIKIKSVYDTSRPSILKAAVQDIARRLRTYIKRQPRTFYNRKEKNVLKILKLLDVWFTDVCINLNKFTFMEV